MARAFRASGWQVVSRVEVPAALPSILGGMRVGVTLAVIGAIVGEWAGGERGLGVLINIARGSLFDIPLMFAALAQLALIGVSLYLVMVAHRAPPGRRAMSRSVRSPEPLEDPSPVTRRSRTAAPFSPSPSSPPSSPPVPACPGLAGVLAGRPRVAGLPDRAAQSWMSP